MHYLRISLIELLRTIREREIIVFKCDQYIPLIFNSQVNRILEKFHDNNGHMGMERTFVHYRHNITGKGFITMSSNTSGRVQNIKRWALSRSRKRNYIPYRLFALGITWVSIWLKCHNIIKETITF